MWGKLWEIYGASSGCIDLVENFVGEFRGEFCRVSFLHFFLGHFQPENVGNERATIYILVLVEVQSKFQKLYIETLRFNIWTLLLGFGSLDSTARRFLIKTIVFQRLWLCRGDSPDKFSGKKIFTKKNS